MFHYLTVDWRSWLTFGSVATAAQDGSEAAGGGPAHKEAVMPQEIERGEVRRLLADGAHLVEVLPAEDFNEDHLPGAVSIPLRRIDAGTVGGLDKDRPVIVYCWDSA
jgi:hypothetical protein